MEKRNGLVIEAGLTETNPRAEGISSLHMIKARAGGPKPLAVGAEEAWVSEDMVNELRSMNATSHVAGETRAWTSEINRRTNAHVGYAVNLRIRKRIDKVFCWIKTVAGRSHPRSLGSRRRWTGVHFNGGCIKVRASAETARRPRVKTPPRRRLIGVFGIIEPALWNLDLCDPARLTPTAEVGDGAFGALEANLNAWYASSSIHLRWAESDEGDRVESEFAYDSHNEALLNVTRDASLTARWMRI